MQKRTCLAFVFSGLALACAGGTAPAGSASPAPPAPDAASFNAHGLTVARPEGWRFVGVDGSVAADTLAILHGPQGDHLLVPVVEIGRRPLSASEGRQSATSVLETAAMELRQTVEGFDTEGAPQETTLGGSPAAMLKATLTEVLPSGDSEERRVRYYATVSGQQVWMVRCLGPKDGSADADIDAIIGSITLAQQ